MNEPGSVKKTVTRQLLKKRILGFGLLKLHFKSDLDLKESENKVSSGTVE